MPLKIGPKVGFKKASERQVDNQFSLLTGFIFCWYKTIQYTTAQLILMCSGGNLVIKTWHEPEMPRDASLVRFCAVKENDQRQ